MTCPRCKAQAKGHCPDTNRHCHWYRCPQCKSVLNPTRKRGYDGAYKPFTWK